MLLEQREMLRAGQRWNGAVTTAALGLLFQPGNPASDPSFLFLLIQIQLACFFWNTFDPDIEKRGKFERAEPDCGLSPDLLFCCNLAADSWWWC